MMNNVIKTVKVRIGKQVIGKVEECEGGRFIAYIVDPDPTLQWKHVGYGGTMETALEKLGNAIMHKLWTVDDVTAQM